MQLRSKYNKGFRFLLCVIDIFSKYVFSKEVVPLIDEKFITITNVFLKVLNESAPKPNKIWVEKGSEFYNRLMKSWLQDNDTEMHSTHNEENLMLLKYLFED